MMGIVICVSKTEGLDSSWLYEQMSGICEDVSCEENKLLFVPRAGKLMAVLAILNQGGIAYHFQSSKENEPF